MSTLSFRSFFFCFSLVFIFEFLCTSHNFCRFCRREIFQSHTFITNINPKLLNKFFSARNVRQHCHSNVPFFYIEFFMVNRWNCRYSTHLSSYSLDETFVVLCLVPFLRQFSFLLFCFRFVHVQFY